MLKTIIGKLERKKIMMWILMQLNWNVATINVMLQLLDIYRFVQKTNQTQAQVQIQLLNKPNSNIIMCL